MSDFTFNQTGPLTVLLEDYDSELSSVVEEISLTEDATEIGTKNETEAEPVRTKRGLNYLQHATNAPDT